MVENSGEGGEETCGQLLCGVECVNFYCVTCKEMVLLMADCHANLSLSTPVSLEAQEHCEGQ